MPTPVCLSVRLATRSCLSIATSLCFSVMETRIRHSEWSERRLWSDARELSQERFGQIRKERKEGESEDWR